MSLSISAQTLLDTAPESTFDVLTKLAAHLLHVPVSLISVLDDHRQFFKSQCGLPEPWASRRETPLSHSFCQHVTATGTPLIVEDARRDALVRENLAVIDVGVIAYLGVPLCDAHGVTYGALCAICSEPRIWTEGDFEIMQALAAQVMSEVSLRVQVREQRQELTAFEKAEQERAFAARADRHDLRTPLNALLLSLQGMRILGDLNEDQTASLDMAERNGREITKMIDQMLDIGGIDIRGQSALTKCKIEPQALVARALEQVAMLAGVKKQTLQCSAGPVETLLADAEKVVRVLVNLLGNAIKFAPEKGTIAIDVADSTEAGHPAVTFTVRDNGIGLSEVDAQRVFTEGFRVDPSAPTRRSTGIGLTFCKRIVEAHGGRIWIDSKPSEGATFRFVLPVFS